MCTDTTEIRCVPTAAIYCFALLVVILSKLQFPRTLFKRKSQTLSESLRKKQKKRTIHSWGAAIVIFLVLMIVTPTIPQSQAYHDFADQRSFFGIPNALNVISNFPFLIIGLVGLVLCFYPDDYFRFSLRGEKLGWTWFFVGMAAVAFGSSYYHLHPDDARLVWDCLPVRSISSLSLRLHFDLSSFDH